MPTNLTHEQILRQAAAQRFNVERQNRMPRASRPRLSPRKLMPQLSSEKAISQRVCVEKPETHPNDYRYLYRVAQKQNHPEFYWADSDGQITGNKLFPSLYAACVYMHKQGWEDASW